MQNKCIQIQYSNMDTDIDVEGEILADADNICICKKKKGHLTASQPPLR